MAEKKDAAPPESLTTEAYALTRAITDPGPDTLDVEDTPDDVKERNPSPRPEDGAQDQTQDPDDMPDPAPGKGTGQ
jgi:hypothetical protein